MKPTKASPLVILGLLGIATAWIAELMLVGSGRPSLVPPITLGIALGLIGVLVVLGALPVFRVARGIAGARVDPFYATRIVLLAKASSLTGAILTGFAVSVLVFLLSRSVPASGGSVAMAIVTLVGAALLLTGGLVAEKMCTLPPSDDDAGVVDTIAL